MIDPGDLFGEGATSWTPISLFASWDAFEFTVTGYTADTAACAHPDQATWLSLSSTSGTIAWNSYEAVDVTLTGTSAGVYDKALCITNNDPDTPMLQVPLTLTVKMNLYLPIYIQAYSAP